MSTAVHRSPNKLWISNSIFNLWSENWMSFHLGWFFAWKLVSSYLDWFFVWISVSSHLYCFLVCKLLNSFDCFPCLQAGDRWAHSLIVFSSESSWADTLTEFSSESLEILAWLIGYLVYKLMSLCLVCFLVEACECELITLIGFFSVVSINHFHTVFSPVKSVVELGVLKFILAFLLWRGMKLCNFGQERAGGAGEELSLIKSKSQSTVEGFHQSLHPPPLPPFQLEIYKSQKS